MHIIIETEIDGEVEELERYNSDVCPREGEKIAIYDKEEEFLFYKVCGVEYAIRPNSSLAAVRVVPVNENSYGAEDRPLLIRGIDWAKDCDYSVEAKIDTSDGKLTVLDYKRIPKDAIERNMPKLLRMMQKHEWLKNLSSEDLVEEVLKTDAADCLEVEALMDRVCPGWELKDRESGESGDDNREYRKPVELVDFMARACHYAQEHIDDAAAWSKRSEDRWKYLTCVDYQMACFLAQNTVEGDGGVECGVVLDELTGRPMKSISQWLDILNARAKELGGWKTK